MSSSISNLQQQIFSTAMLVNLCQQFPWSPSDDASACTKQAITSILGNPDCNQYTGNWEIVWGPCVVSASIVNFLPIPMNGMYIAYNATENIYLVAIAGTDGSSFKTWITEDFNIMTTVPLPFSNGGGPDVTIANGTSLAMQVLMGMIDPTSQETALTFLQNTVTSSDKIYVCGHSLGGTLSPVMAVYLKNNISDVDTYCMPVASLTSGNWAFSHYYNTLFPDGNNLRIWNTKDMAPHCFELDTLAELPFIYEPNISAGPYWTAFIALLIVLSADNLYLQIPTYYSFTADMFLPADLPNDPSGPYTSFTDQVRCQHVPAYGYQLCNLEYLTNVAVAFNNIQFPNNLALPIQGLFFTSDCSAPSGTWG